MKPTTSIVLGVALAVAASVGAASSLGGCSAKGCVGGQGGFGCDDADGGTTDGGASDDGLFPDQWSDFSAQCSQASVSVAIGQQTPVVTCTATSANASWKVLEGEIASMSTANGLQSTFIPTGTTGGVANVQVTLGSDEKTAKTIPILVQLHGSSNGNCPPSQIATSVAQLSAGGGIGGVGGEGCGNAVDSATENVLANPTNDGSAQNLAWLYPYDKTVWPRGMLAPLLQWSWSFGNADAVQITLSTPSGSFSWTGTYTAPTILGQTGGKFIHHPIPDDIWTIATNTAGTKINEQRDDLTVTLTLAKNGQGYGPVSETWPVAPGRLTGTMYYNSYGTRLVQNFANDGAGHPIGAAVLRIRSGDLAPTVAAGYNSSDGSGCRACHTVSSRGGVLLAQSEDPGYTDEHSHYYDLSQTSPADQSLSPDGKFTWSALTSDGKLAFTNTTWPSCINEGIAPTSTKSELWTMSPNPSITTWSGLPSSLAAGYPAFSPDDAFLSYVDVSAHPSTAQGPLMLAAFDKTTHAFSSLTTLAPPATGKLVGFPSFLPDNSGVLFETQVRASPGGGGAPNGEGVGCSDQNYIVTRLGARGELWWVNTSGTAQPVPLATLNGKSYLPTGPNNHGAGTASDPNDSFSENGWDDTTLDYEPTVLPVAVGGYAWVVFTSRRMYGNELENVPFMSWPPEYDTSNLALGTTKKLYVAAIDLNAPLGTDPSHPAFYLPAQELVAGNSRGFWALDPCHNDGDSCTSGDQCCGGYCEPPGDGGALACGSTPPTCGSQGDSCNNSSDCCSGYRCVGTEFGHCDVAP